MSQIVLKLNFKKCPMCHSRNIEKAVVNILCNDCLAMFVRRTDSLNKESLICVWNRKLDGTLFEPHNDKVFIVLEDPEVVHFT